MSELSPTTPIKFSNIKKSLGTSKETYLLNNLPTNVRDSCTTAFGLRRLIASYTGPVVRARRDSDNAYSDFFADESGLLTNASGTTYTDWLGTATGYLAKWYDQSGTGKDVGQGNAFWQPVLSTTKAYPPAGMTADTSVLSGNRYGNGTYVVSASSSNNGTSNQHGIFRAFDKTLVSGNYWLSGTDVSYQYNATTGLYQGTSTLAGVSGEWVKIQLPEPIVLKTYSLFPREDLSNRTPKEYKILGSNDNTNWTIVDDRILDDWTTFASRNFAITNTKPFLYYAIVITKNGNSTATSRSFTAIGEWTLNALSDPEIIYDGSVSHLDTMETHSYPPAPLTTDNQTVLMAFPPPMSADTDVIDGQTYTATTSTVYNASAYPTHGIFNDSVNSIWHSEVNRYNDTTGAYTGTVSTTASGTAYTGEWIQIQLPTAIKLHTYTLMSRDTWSQRAPSSFVILGSNDGSTWALVDTRTSVTTWANRTQLTFSPNSNTAYTYFRLVARATSTTGTTKSTVNIAQWRLFTNSIATLRPPGSMIANETEQIWVPRSIPVNNNWSSVCWSQELSLFVAVGRTGTNNRVMTSSDGITWTTRTSAIDVDWRGICWSPERSLFVAVGLNTSSRIMTSPDGINWTARSIPVNNNFWSVVWSPQRSLFVAVGDTGSSNRVITSSDGITWTARSTNNNNYLSVCWSPERSLFVAIAYSGSGDRVMSSPDGITWTPRSSAADNFWRGVCWSPERGLFVAVAEGGTGRVMTSPDGITWTLSYPPDGAWRQVCWSPELSLFAAISSSGSYGVMTSPDGINWTLSTSASSSFWQGITWSPQLRLFVIVGESSVSLTSDALPYIASASSFATDGRFPWTAFESNNTTFWNSSSDNLYDSTTGLYLGSNSLGGISGEWLKLQMPSAIVLHNYTIHPRLSNANIRNPKEYKLLGSNDNVNWSVLDDRTGSRALANWATSTAARTFQTSNVSQAYRYFAIVVTVTGDSGETDRVSTAIQQLEFRTTPVVNNFKTNGNYNVSVSSSHPDFPIRQAFDNVTSGTNFWSSSDSSANFAYNGTTGIYSGINNTLVKNITYSGEWLQLKLPKPINIGSFTITPRQDSSLWLTRSPRSFVLLGSNDGSNWNLVDEETNVNDWTSATKTFVVNGSGNIYYDHYRIVVRRVGNSDNGSNQTSVQITEMKFIELSVPIAPGDDTYTFVADWTPTSTSGSGVMIEQNTSTLITSRRAALLRLSSNTYGFNGNSNDAHTLVPYVVNVNKKSVMICDHTTTGINVKIVDNGTVYNGTTSAPSSLDVGGNYFVIGRRIDFTESYTGPLNEVILFRNAVPIDAALRYTSASNTVKTNVPDPVPDLWLDFHPKDTTAMHNNFGLFTDAACDISMLQTLPNNTAVSTWNGYAQGTAGNRPIYYSSGGYLNENGFVRFNRTSSQHLSGGERALNVATNGGFTAVALVKFTGTAASWEKIFDLGQGQANNNIYLARSDVSSNLLFSMRNVNTQVVNMVIPNGITQDEWAVFAVRYNAATLTTEMFKNGAVLTTITASAAVTDKSATGMITYIGRSNWSVDSYFNGDIAGLYINDKFLTDTELSAVTAQMMYPSQPARLPNSLIPKTQGYVLYEPFRNGYAARFNNSANTFIDIQNVPALPFSFSFWFNIQSSAYQTIVGLNNINRNSPGIQLDYNTAGTTANELRVYVWVNGAWTYGSLTSITTNTWYHLTVRIQSTCQVNVHLNGSTSSTNINTGNVTTNSIPARSRLIVGSSGDTSRGFNGYIADFRVYNRLLNVSEVPLSALYSSASQMQSSTIQDTSNYLVNARNYLTEMKAVNKQGTFVPFTEGTRQRIQLRLTNNTVNNSVNVLSHPFRIQDYESFVCSFEVYIENATAENLFFFSGSKLRELPSGPDSDNDAVFVNLQVGNGSSLQSPGIGIVKNGKLVSSKNTTNWIGTSTWYPVTINYNKRAKDTWVVNFNGDEIAKYSDPDVLTSTQRTTLTDINTDGLICYFDPSNPSCYPGTGNQLYSLVGNATGTLVGTYNFMGGNIRLTNTSSNIDLNLSHLQLSTLQNIRTISIWYYQHSTTGSNRYLLDARTGIANGQIHAQAVGSYWSSGILYKNGGSAQSVTWGNIETTGVWQNITLVANSSGTDNPTLFARYETFTTTAPPPNEGLDVTFGPIFVYNRVLTEAENLANYNAVLNSKNLRCWGIGAASSSTSSMNSYIRRLELSYTESKSTAGAIIRSGALGNSTEVRLSNLYNKQRGLVDGLTYKVYYNGYWGSNVNFFNTNTPNSIGRSSDFTNLRISTNGEVFNGVGFDNFSVEWVGYFRPNVTGTWTIGSGSDDASSIWIGATALAGYTTGNRTANSAATGTISLVAGQFYPIRVIYGESGGLEEIYFTFTPPGGTALRNLSGMVFSSIGTNADFPAESAKIIKSITGTNEDGMYYINCNGVSTQTYCLMNDAYDGGGWMMMMKGTRGTTFNYDSTHWTTTSTLNPTNANRDDGDAKYDTFNYQNINDVLAIFPDVTSTPAFNIILRGDASYLAFYSDLDPLNNNSQDGRALKVFLRQNNFNCYLTINSTVVQVYGLIATNAGTAIGNGTYEVMRLAARTLSGANVTTNATFNGASDIVVTITPMETNTGSLRIPDGWSWKVENWNAGTRTTALSGFQTSRDATPSDPYVFSGYYGRIWSHLYPSARHIFGGGTHISADMKVRWGFVFNNESNFTSIDAFGGIGMTSSYWNAGSNYSAGDTWANWYPQASGLNRSMRFEMYGR